ncbi:MAG: CoA pyrophosphatase, partial [Pseudomonadota bacterium]
MSAPHTHRDLIRRALATSAPSVVQAGAGEPPGESGEGDEHDPLVIANRSQGKRPREAGVLVPLVEREAGLNLILTRRSEHLPTHAGQISFPGGSQDPDDRDAVDTALREAEEEIGLQRRLVDIAGSLDRYETGTGFILNPVVGFVDPAFTPRADPGEVAEVFEVPLA